MKVSVVIPCHNAAAYLEQTLASVLAQSRPAAEVIVVDDASTDGSVAIARRFAAEHAQVQVVEEHNGSAPITRNHGAALATGDALMFLDADDLLGPIALAALHEALTRSPTGFAACPWFRIERHDGEWMRRPASCEPRREGQHPLDAWLRGWYHPPCSVLWSRQAFQTIGGWDETLIVNQDGDLVMRALASGLPLTLTAEGEALYRRLPEGEASVSGRRRTPEGLACSAEVVRRIAETLERRNILDEHRGSLAVAFDRLAAAARGVAPEVAAQCLADRRRYGDAGFPRVIRQAEAGARTSWRTVRGWFHHEQDV